MSLGSREVTETVTHGRWGQPGAGKSEEGDEDATPGRLSLAASGLASPRAAPRPRPIAADLPVLCHPFRESNRPAAPAENLLLGCCQLGICNLKGKNHL